MVLIHDESSPTTYRFAMNVPEGGYTKVNPDGSATVYDKDGNAIRQVARPWAFDAAGRPQKTWYTVDENGDLIQHVEPAENALYPILADPTDSPDPGRIGLDEAAGRSEGDSWTTDLPNGGKVVNTIPEGNGDQSVHQEILNPDGSVGSVQDVASNGQGGYQRWATNSDGTSAYRAQDTPESEIYGSSWDAGANPATDTPVSTYGQSPQMDWSRTDNADGSWVDSTQRQDGNWDHTSQGSNGDTVYTQSGPQGENTNVTGEVDKDGMGWRQYPDGSYKEQTLDPSGSLVTVEKDPASGTETVVVYPSKEQSDRGVLPSKKITDTTTGTVVEISRQPDGSWKGTEVQEDGTRTSIAIRDIGDGQITTNYGDGRTFVQYPGGGPGGLVSEGLDSKGNYVREFSDGSREIVIGERGQTVDGFNYFPGDFIAISPDGEATYDLQDGGFFKPRSRMDGLHRAIDADMEIISIFPQLRGVGRLGAIGSKAMPKGDKPSAPPPAGEKLPGKGPGEPANPPSGKWLTDKEKEAVFGPSGVREGPAPSIGVERAEQIAQGKWPGGSKNPGTKGGAEWRNDRGDLPALGKDGKPITYREWDVNPRVPKEPRDTERIVTGSDGSVWYTPNHYWNFWRVS
ncbi:ribonuclease domain-containing protein [Gordonia malaquae]|uniref:ribonuclease domain-containing protein n=1 Tax=Gordonia malaquae TaxID=410332 RepID=UPI0030C79FF9